MPQHRIHPQHAHVHGEGCGHTAIRHGDHVDYLHDGCLRTMHGGHVDECRLEITLRNPDASTPAHQCSGHEPGQVHGPGCGHEAVPHGGHMDCLAGGHLHHPPGGHCDDHGPVELIRNPHAS